MFVQNEKNGIIYMTSYVLRVPHAFTTRYGGVSKGIYESLNMASNSGDDLANVIENYSRVLALFGSLPEEAAVTKQVHGSEVRLCTYEDRHVPASDVPYEADGLVTTLKGMPLMCFTADCVPALLCDAENGVIAAVHCGWRSSVADILGVTVSKMESAGALRKNICCAFGPAIGPCHFETHDDVTKAVGSWLEGDTEGLFKDIGGGKYLVDLRKANARRLERLGIPGENIDISDECTVCSHEKYWSHRYTKGRRGSQASVICLNLEI